MWEAADFVDGEADSANEERRIFESAIRADERAKCRAELREQIEGWLAMDPSDFRTALVMWTGTEAFGGE